MKPEKTARKRRLPWRRILLLPAVLLLAVAAYFIESRSGWLDLYRAAGVSLDAPDADLLAQTSTTVTVLDVGQGDGIMISDGREKHIFIDGGSTSENAVGTYRLLPFLKYHRIRQIDAWIVTHTDADHISGLTEALESGYPICRLLLAKAAPQDDALEHLVTLAKENSLTTQSGGTVFRLHRHLT